MSFLKTSVFPTTASKLLIILSLLSFTSYSQAHTLTFILIIIKPFLLFVSIIPLPDFHWSLILDWPMMINIVCLLPWATNVSMKVFVDEKHPEWWTQSSWLPSWLWVGLIQSVESWIKQKAEERDIYPFVSCPTVWTGTLCLIFCPWIGI